MGLDWVLYGRPRPGAEAEFARLTKTIHRLDEPELRLARTPRQEATLRRATRRRDELALSPFAEVGCPCIGVDEAADRWLRARYRERHADAADEWAALPLEEVRRRFQGTYVPELIRDLDGVARVQGPLGGILSFRGQVVAAAAEIIGREPAAAAYLAHTAEDGLHYAALLDQRLGEHLDACAAQALSRAEAEQLEMLLEGVRWLRYWGRRGFGFEPWF